MRKWEAIKLNIILLLSKNTYEWPKFRVEFVPVFFFSKELFLFRNHFAHNYNDIFGSIFLRNWSKRSK